MKKYMVLMSSFISILGISTIIFMWFEGKMPLFPAVIVTFSVALSILWSIVVMGIKQEIKMAEQMAEQKEICTKCYGYGILVYNSTTGKFTLSDCPKCTKRKCIMENKHV